MLSRQMNPVANGRDAVVIREKKHVPAGWRHVVFSRDIGVQRFRGD